MAKKRSEVLREEMEALRAEIKVIEENEEASEEEISRGGDLLAEWDDKKTDYDKALERERKVDEVLRAALQPESTEDTSPARTRTPEVMRKVEPYETTDELVR